MSSSVPTLKTRARRRPVNGGAVLVPRSGAKASAPNKVKFGDVVVTTRKPSKAELQQNVDFSSAALARANAGLVRPGIRIYPKKDVPLYFADPDNPGGIIRKLNGTLQRGVVEDGQFKATD